MSGSVSDLGVFLLFVLLVLVLGVDFPFLETEIDVLLVTFPEFCNWCVKRKKKKMAARALRPPTSVVPPSVVVADEEAQKQHKADGQSSNSSSKKRVFAQAGVVTQAKGSALFEIGNTKVIAAW